MLLQAVSSLREIVTSGGTFLMLLDLLSKAVQAIITQQGQAKAQVLHAVVAELPSLAAVLDRACAAKAVEQDLQWQVGLLVQASAGGMRSERCQCCTLRCISIAGFKCQFTHFWQ